MKRNFTPLIFSFFLVLFLAVLFSFTPKAKAETEKDLPEQAGTYDVPGHPKLKLRVFVYNPGKPLGQGKPSPTPPPIDVKCPLDSTTYNSFISSAGWRLPSTWTYTLNTSYVPSTVGGNNLAAIAGNAFSQWTQAIPNKVNISKNPDNTTVNRAKLDGQNIIAWGRTSGSALAVTYTWYDPSTGYTVEVDTIMNQKYPWFWNASGNNMCTDQNSYDAQDILTHELGHWYGLDDVYTSEFVDNTMYGYGSKGETKKDTLTTGDINGISAIY